MHTRSPILLVTGLALALALVLSRPAGAESEEATPGLGAGDAAVDFEGKEFVNTEPLSLRALRGRVVLMELFSTG